ncbi:MAG TPA: carboxypeptidase-like regulatory domain-containing protein [Pirellulales bacterium]|nr:carboxypeptidase-like regulatory domain-containing protein [Pirellulales bacterium]
MTQKIAVALISAIVLLDAAQVPCMAEEPPNSVPAVGAIWRMSVHGQVVDSERRPLANARVVLRSSIKRVDAVQDMHLFDLPDILAETRADETGRFAFNDVPLGPEARQMAEMLEQNHRGAEVVAIADGFGIGWTPLSALATTAEVKVALNPAAAIEGVVQNETGAPLAGAVVEAIAISRFDQRENPLAEKPYNLRLTLSALCPRAIADDQGRFRIEGLPADHLISLWPRHRDHPQKFFLAASVPQPPAESFVVRSGEPASETPVQVNPVRLSLAGGTPRLTIQVFDQEGRRPRGRRIWVLGTQTSDKVLAPLPENSELHVAVQAPGMFRVIYLPPEEQGGLRISRDVVLSNAEIAAPYELRLDLPPARELTGRVVGAGGHRGLSGVMVVWANKADGRSEDFVSSHAITDAWGRFRLPVVAGQGKIKLLGEASGIFIDNRRNSPRAEAGQYTHAVDIPETGPIEPLWIEVPRGLVIRGVVTDATGASAREIVVAASRDIPITSPAARTVTAVDGRFEIAGLDPREPYWLSAIGDGLAGFATVTGEPDHSVSQVREAEADLVLKPAVTLAGRVLLAGRPQPGVRLTLFRHGQRGHREPHAVTSDEDGRYRLSGLQPGDKYSIGVEPKSPALDAAWSHQWPHIVKLPEMAQSDVELPEMNLRPLTQSLAGMVVDPRGKPVVGARVTAMHGKNGGFVHYASRLGRRQAFTETDAAGRFELQELPDEPLSLMAYMQPKGADRRIRFDVRVNANSNQKDIRIVLDPSLTKED